MPRTGRPADLIYYVVIHTIGCIDAPALYDVLASLLTVARERFTQVIYAGCTKRAEPELKFYVQADTDGSIGV